MKSCRITVIRKACYKDLSDKYENPIEHACDLYEGQTFVSIGGCEPKMLCESAWESMRPFIDRVLDLPCSV